MPQPRRRRSRRAQLQKTAVASSSNAASSGATSGAGSASSAEEVGHLLEQVAQAVSHMVRPAEGVPAFTLWNDLPVSG